jgi:hypothetical protein
MRLSPLGTAATTGLFYQPQMIDDDEFGAVGGMRIGRGIRRTQRNPARVPLCPSQISYDQTRVRKRAAAVGSRWFGIYIKIPVLLIIMISSFWGLLTSLEMNIPLFNNVMFHRTLIVEGKCYSYVSLRLSLHTFHESEHYAVWSIIEVVLSPSSVVSYKII